MVRLFYYYFLSSSSSISIHKALKQVLDADKGDRLESSTGRVASRDIVQFVPFRDVQGKLFCYDETIIF